MAPFYSSNFGSPFWAQEGLKPSLMVTPRVAMSLGWFRPRKHREANGKLPMVVPTKIRTPAKTQVFARGDNEGTLKGESVNALFLIRNP